MVHTERYYKLKRLQTLIENLSHIVGEMAFNEDLPVFDSQLEREDKSRYMELINAIGKLRNELGL